MVEKEVAPKTYARKASGLIREIGALDALLICIACILPGCLQFSLMVFWSGFDWNLFVIIGMVPLIIHAVVYSMMGSAMPRSGGDYVAMSRILHPSIGFTMNFVFIIGASIILGSMTPWIGTMPIQGFLTSIALVTGSAEAMEWGSAMSSPTWVVIIGILVILLTGVLMTRSTKTVVRIMRYSMFYALAAIAVTIILNFAGTNSAFISSWNGAFGTDFGTVPQIIVAAEETGLSYQPPSWGGTAPALIMGLWMWFGYFVAQYFSGEVKNPPTSMITAHVGSLVVVGTTSVIWAAAIASVFGFEFFYASNFLYHMGGIAVFPTITFLTVTMNPNLILSFFLWSAWFVAFIALFLSYVLFISRCMFAWAFDRVMPEKLAYVSKRGSPIVAVVVTCILAVVGTILSAQTEMLAQLNWPHIVSLVFAVASFAMIFFPFVKKDVFESSPGYVKHKIGGVIPLVSVLSAISCGFMLYMLYTAFTEPAIGGLVTPTTVGIMIGAFIIAFVLYYIIRYYRLKTEGIDISKAHKEIPPI